MRKYYVIEGADKVYTEKEFEKLSYWYKGKRNRCLGVFKNRAEAEKVWYEETCYPGFKDHPEDYLPADPVEYLNLKKGD